MHKFTLAKIPNLMSFNRQMEPQEHIHNSFHKYYNSRQEQVTSTSPKEQGVYFDADGFGTD